MFSKDFLIYMGIGAEELNEKMEFSIRKKEDFLHFLHKFVILPSVKKTFIYDIGHMAFNYDFCKCIVYKTNEGGMTLELEDSNPRLQVKIEAVREDWTYGTMKFEKNLVSLVFYNTRFDKGDNDYIQICLRLN